MDEHAGHSPNRPSTSDINLQEGWNTFILRPSDWRAGDLLNVIVRE